MLAGDHLLLQPKESLRLPFSLQVYKSSEEACVPSAADRDGEEPCGGAGSARAPLAATHHIRVRLINRSTGQTVRHQNRLPQ